MIKKILTLIFILAAALFFALNLLAQRAPGLLRKAIERSLNKEVTIRSIEYHFPGVFELEGFEVKEKAPFSGEPSFSVDQVRLEVSPLSLSKKMLIINKIEVENAEVEIIKYQGKLFHSLTNAIHTNAPSSTDQRPVPGTRVGGPAAGVPFEIHQFLLKKSHFKFVDYDAEESGFVIVLDDIDAEVKNIVLPFSPTKTTYRIEAHLSQGRDQHPAPIDLTGWTRFDTWDTDANLNMQGVWLPYFHPYYAQVTQATIQDGFVDSRANLRIEQKDLTLNVDLEVVNLLFQVYESGNELFGLKADEILSFLKDKSGRLKLQFVARWNLADRSVKARNVIRKSIERSLKNTVLGNVGNILERTIQKLSEHGMDQTKDDFEGTIKKVKELFR